MDKIHLNTIRLYSYHGCLPEERRIGSDYTVDLEVEADLSLAAQTDNLEDTIDYVRIHEIVKMEMEIPSDLLEHVAKRISNEVLREFPAIVGVAVRVTKCNPPIMGDVKSVSVTLEVKR